MKSELPDNFLANCTFLFGAGASKDANIPLTHELYDQLIDEIENGYARNTSIDVRWAKYLKKFYELTKGNFEQTIAIIKYLSILKPQRPALYLAINFLTDFDKKSVEGEEVTDFFYKFWVFISHQFLQEKLEAKLGNLSYLDNLMSLAKIKHFSIFTLNYDDVIEKACQKNGVDIQLGFDKKNKWFTNSFSAMEKGIKLYKLHGSIHWKHNLINVGPYYEQIFQDIIGMDSSSMRMWEPALIIGDEKLETKGHFLDMFFSFKEELSKQNNLCIVGYSFQDAHINKLLWEWYNKDNKNKHVLIVDPSLSIETPTPRIIAPGFALKEPGFTDLKGYKILAGGRQLDFVTTIFDVFMNGNRSVIYPQKIGFKDFLSNWKI